MITILNLFEQVEHAHYRHQNDKFQPDLTLFTSTHQHLYFSNTLIFLYILFANLFWSAKTMSIADLLHAAEYLERRERGIYFFVYSCCVCEI